MLLKKRGNALLGVICQVSNGKTLMVKDFAFLKNVCCLLKVTIIF